MIRRMCRAVDSAPRMWPMPWQRGQAMCADSASAGRRRWRESSMRPKREILPSCTRARSYLSASRRRFSTSLVLRALHVDEVDHDQAAQVTQPQLARDFVGRFAVGVERGGFDVATLGRACRIDVDGDERLGMVDHDGAAGGQGYLTGVGGFDLVLDLEAREQRN